MSSGFMRGYDVAADGQRLLTVVQGSEPQIEIVLHWAEDVARLVPVN
jgi:hypothetical protein